MPVYNAQKYIAEALNSVVNQTYPNIEIIVVNDGSTDRSRKLLDEYVSRYNNIVLINQDNIGQDRSLNKGFRHAKGEYIKFFDADDVLSLNAIESQVEGIRGAPDKVAYGKWSRFFNDDFNTAEFKDHSYYKNMPSVNFLTSDKTAPMLQCGILLMHRDLINKSGLWHPKLILFNDTEFYFRLILNSKGIVFTPEAKLYYRSGHSESLTAQTSLVHYKSTFLATRLMEKHLLTRENSHRTRRLLANLYQMRRYDMYPNFILLSRQHKRRIKELGGSSYSVQSGKLYNAINSFFGWKIAKLIKMSFNNLGFGQS